MRIGNENLLETDLYDAELIDYTDTRADGTPLMTNPYSEDDEPKPQWRLTAELTGEGFEGVRLPVWITKPVDETNIHPKAKLVQLARAALSEAEAAGDWVIDDLLHRPIRLQVELYKKRDGTDANKVTKFLPPKKDSARSPAARQPAPARAREPEQVAVPF